MGCGSSLPELDEKDSSNRPTNLQPETTMSSQNKQSEEATSPSPSSSTASIQDETLHDDKDTASLEQVMPSWAPSHTWWRYAGLGPITQDNDSPPWWEVCDKLTPSKTTVIKPDTKRRGWKTIRIFVSSTFKDMHSEREYLVKRVFPQLRQWCEEKRLRLVECDLRWGIPKDADARQTLLTCLSEIDRCYEENEFPYFLALLSERYGWVPSPEEVPSDITHRYKWMPGMSVTTLEIMTGGFWPRNPNALYMLRTPEYLQDITRPEVKKNYEEYDGEIQVSLDKLKECVHTIPSDQGTVKTYHCNVEGLEDKRACITGLEDFGEMITEHFKAAINKQYPAEALGTEMSLEEEQYSQHEAFMTQRSALLLGRDDILKQTDNYINQDRNPQVPLVLIGYPGAGKSAVMATVARRYQDRENFHLFYHFVGATPGSTDLLALLRRLWKELMPSQDQVPTDPEELKRSMAVVLGTMGKRMEGQKKLIILVDALNQLDSEGNENHMIWLTRVLPPGVRVIVSTLEGPCLEALRRIDQSSTKLPELLVAPLGKKIRREIVKKTLSEYNKILDDTQMSVLLDKTDAGRPLYLAIACEELRVFGEFRKLTDKIQGLDPDLTNLLVQVLDRIIAENGGDLVLNTLCLIESSRFGLLENELLQLLASYSKMVDQGAGSEEKLPMAEWALVYLGLRQFLRPAGGSGEGRLDFYHRTISKAVRSKYLQAQNKHFWNKKLVDYFKNCPDKERRTEELPYQLIAYGDREGLTSMLVEMDTFERLYTPSHKQLLMNYWTQAGGYGLAGDRTVQAHHNHVQSMPEMSDEEKIRLYSRLIMFLTDIGQYQHAEQIASLTLSTGDPQSVALCEPLYAMIILYYLQALKVVYSSDPEYGRCVREGRQIVHRCVEMHKKVYSHDDIHLGRVLTKCGYFHSNYLDEARKICEVKSSQDYAEILYMIGEKNQYHDDINVPKDYFEKSLKLCLGHFGYFHLNTARCYQLYGQLYWNRNTGNGHSMLEQCLKRYKKELEILTEILGAKHPTTLRSREDVMIILQYLGRDQEAKLYE